MFQLRMREWRQRVREDEMTLKMWAKEIVVSNFNFTSVEPFAVEHYFHSWWMMILKLIIIVSIKLNRIIEVAGAEPASTDQWNSKWQNLPAPLSLSFAAFCCRFLLNLHFLHLLQLFHFSFVVLICPPRKVAMPFCRRSWKICFNNKCLDSTTSCRSPAEKYCNQVTNDIVSFGRTIFGRGANEMAGFVRGESRTNSTANNRYLTTFICVVFFVYKLFFFFAFF